MPSKEPITKVAHGDRTKAEALRIAYDRLNKLGWRYSFADVGKSANEILASLAASALGEQAE
ncbi:hypothetical protein BKD02_08370 [Brucella sp. 09RB8910]|nr:hypothetical protein BKD02_08370 [Brucella sp. 09RB8910]